MGDYKDRTDLIYTNLIERLGEEGYEDISAIENNKIVDFIHDSQLEDPDQFERLVREAIKTIDQIRSDNEEAW